jgi:hypothetical protein
MGASEQTLQVETERERELLVPEGRIREEAAVPAGTDFSLIDGVVKFEHKSKTRYKVSVYPADAEAPAA